MCDQQSSIHRNRLPLLRAAAFKNIDIRVVDPVTRSETPFDLQKTEPGCVLNIRWKAAPADQRTPNATFPTLNKGEAGVHQYSSVKYLDPASIAYELHSLAVSNMYGNDRREREFQSTKLIKGLWLYAAIVEHSDHEVVQDFGQLNLFWAMIIHYHRTGKCLPRLENWWSDDACCFNQLLSNFAKGQLQNIGPNARITMPSNVMSFVLRMNQLMGSQGAEPGSAAFERARNNVDFAVPDSELLIPAWWRAHDDLWTKTLDHFVSTGKAPCSWLLKEAGCKNRRSCGEDHEFFVPLVNNLLDLIKKPFVQQMDTVLQVSATGQGIAIGNELSEGAGLSKEERQTKLKEKGNEYTQKQDHTTAIRFYDEAIKIDPDVEAAAAIYSNLSLCHVHKCEFKKALADADKCVAIRPTWFRGHFRRGYALENLGKFDEAVAAFEQVMKLDKTQTEDAEDCKKRCLEAKQQKSEADASSSSNKKTGQAERKKSGDADDDYETVSAVLFPCDPNRRPYEVKIPSNVIAHADEIHSLLGISNFQVSNIDNFLSKHKPVYPAGMPSSWFKAPYSVREWAADQKEKSGGAGLPYAFQPRELVRGENDKSNLMALVNPQSSEAPNIRMCAMLTQMDGKMNVTDADPATCKCRGDALVIRIKRRQSENRPYLTDCRAITWPKYEAIMEQFGARAGELVSEKAGTKEVGVYVEIVAMMNEMLQDTENHCAVDFKYEDYDKVWGLFTHIQIERGKYSTSLMPNTPTNEKLVAEMVRMGISGRR